MFGGDELSTARDAADAVALADGPGPADTVGTSGTAPTGTAATAPVGGRADELPAPMAVAPAGIPGNGGGGTGMTTSGRPGPLAIDPAVRSIGGGGTGTVTSGTPPAPDRLATLAPGTGPGPPAAIGTGGAADAIEAGTEPPAMATAGTGESAEIDDGAGFAGLAGSGAVTEVGIGAVTGVAADTDTDAGNPDGRATSAGPRGPVGSSARPAPGGLLGVTMTAAPGATR